jgi:hypothetical protein
MDADPFASSLDAAALTQGDRPYLIPMDADSVSFAALPHAMRPSYLTVHETLPYTSTSKLQRTELRNCRLPRWDVDAGRWLAGDRESTA